MAKASKKAAPAKKEVTKAIKKEPKKDTKPAPKAPAAKKGATTKGGSKLLELGLLLDCTSSMGSWIERAKTTLQSIV